MVSLMVDGTRKLGQGMGLCLVFSNTLQMIGREWGYVPYARHLDHVFSLV